MAMPAQANYEPCANCGDEWSETIDHSGQSLCDDCFGVWSGGHIHKLVWRDCDKEGHEDDCFVASCGRGDCDWESYDCEEVEQ